MPSIILFVVWAGTLKSINMFRNGQKYTKSAECALSMFLLGGNACRINEVLVLVFNRGDIWLF